MRLAKRWCILLGLIAALLVPEMAAAAAPGQPPADQPQSEHQQEGDSRSRRPDYVPTEPGAEPGDEGENVARMQAYLEKFGYLSRSRHTRGEFDQPTEEALQQFQRRYDLATTGRLDEPTFRLMNTPRYDHYADIGAVADYTVPYDKWNKTDLTYGFANYSSDLSQNAVRSAVADSLALWSEVTPLTFTEQPVSSAYDPDIIISFVSGSHGDGNPFDGPGGTLAHAYYPYQGSSIDGDAHFDEAEAWTVTIPPATGQIDLVSVAAHEFGHSLGLGHSDVSGALMAPYYYGSHRYLHSDDVAGIQSLYGDSSGGGETHDAAVTSITATPSTVTQGDQVSISAEIQNNGSTSEAITVDIGKNPSGLSDSTTVNLGAGASTTVQFTWQTDDQTLVTDHALTVIASVSGDGDSANNSATAVVTVQAASSGGDAMYVSGIDFNSWDFGSRYRLYAKVHVGSADGPVPDAGVTAALSGPGGYSRTMTGTVTSSGYANFVVYVYNGGTYTLNVTDVTKSGWTYDASQDSGNPATINTGGEVPAETHDGAVTTVDAPTSATQGDPVTVAVGVKNNGSVSDDISVSVSNSPAGFSDSTSVNLAAGASTTVQFIWTTDSGTATGDHTFTATVSVPDDNDSGNNSGTATTTIEAANGGETHDAAITSVSAPSSVTQGDVVTVTAEVSNNGTVSESITVSIGKDPAGFSDSTSVTLGAGGSTTVQFNWTTGTGTPTGDHTFTVTASVADDSNGGNDSGSATTAVQAGSSGGEGMHVSGIDFNSWDFGSRYRLYAKVYIESSGSAVPGAEVTAALSGPGGYSRTMTGTVTSSGYANFVVYVYNPGTYTLNVTEVVQSGETYTPALDSGNPASINTSGDEPSETHDAAVTSVEATTSVTQGDPATISVGVKNNGSVSESITVDVSKDPGGFDDSQTVTLGAGASTTVTFEWQTDSSTQTGDHTFTATVSVADDSTSNNNSGTATTTVEAAGGSETHDAGVVSVSAPPSATQGDTVTVTAEVRNNGTTSETVTVEIDTSPSGFNETKTVTLASGDSTTVQFDWTTGTGTPTGDHTFTITTSVPDDSNSGNDTGTATTTINAAGGGGDQMHVSEIDFRYWDFGSRYRLYAKVFIETGDTPVPGAEVTASITGPGGYSRTMTGTVTSSGYANFVVYVYNPGTYTVTVLDVEKSGETYNEDQNVVDSASVNAS